MASKESRNVKDSIVNRRNILLGGSTLAVCGNTAAASPTGANHMINNDIEQACMASLDRWMTALNAHDADAMDKEMHFPHVRLAEGRLVVYERPGSNPMDLFNSLIQKSNWDHSAWTKRVPIQSSESKVHWAVEYKRFTKDGTVIGTYESLYVMTLKEGQWRTQIRSSFGP